MSFAVLLLSGCGLYTKYERPDVNTEGLVRDPLNPNDTLSLGKVVDGQWTAVNGQDENFGNMPWRSVFTDPKLQELIQQGWTELQLHPNGGQWPRPIRFQ